MTDYYKVLGLKPGASIDEIKTAYRKLSKKFHPDVNQGDKFFEERFKEIQEAYEKLSDESYRNSFSTSSEPKSTYKTSETYSKNNTEQQNTSRQTYSSTKQKKAPQPTNKSGSSIFSKIFGFIIIAVISVIVKQAVKPKYDSSPTITPIESVSPYQEQSSNIPVTLPDETEEHTWNQYSFYNCKFQIPDNLQFEESISAGNSRVYVDSDQNIAVSLNVEQLDTDKMDAQIDNFSENLKSFAMNVTENNQRKFDDFVLINYRLSSLGTEKAIEIEQLSTKLSGKNIEMKVIGYYVIAAPYFYTITFSLPNNDYSSEETLNRIVEGFSFQKSTISTSKQTDENVAYDTEDFSTSKIINFNHGKATFPKAAFPKLQHLVALLKDRTYSYVKIEGHTDSDGSDYDNMQLSENRAAAVKNYLIENGISASKIISEGFGETHPINTNYTEFGKSENNRVQIKIYDVN